MRYNKVVFFTFPVLFVAFKFLPVLVNIWLFFLLFTALFFFSQTEHTIKIGFTKRFFQTYFFLFFLFISYLILPYYIFLFNALMFLFMEYFKTVQKEKYIRILWFDISLQSILFWGGATFLLMLIILVFGERVRLQSKISSLIIMPLFYSIVSFLPWKRNHLKNFGIYILTFFGQFLFLVLKISDFHIHWYHSAVLTGVPVVFILSILMYLLDMVYKKEIIALFFIQYVLFVFLGNRAFSVFFISFIFFYLQRRAVVEFSYSLSSVHFKKVFKEKNNQIIYFMPFVLSFLSIFVKKNMFYPYFYIMLLSNFSFFVLFFMQDLADIFSRMFHYPFMNTISVKKFGIPNIILILYLVSVFFLTKFSWVTLLISLLSANVFYGLHFWYTEKSHKKWIFYHDIDLISLGYLSSILSCLLFYFVKTKLF